MGSILAPVGGVAYKEGYTGYYGAIEVEEDTEEVVWMFNAADTSMNIPRIDSSNNPSTHSGYRPSSVERLDNGLTLLSGYRRGLLVDEDGDIHTSFTHQLMNDVHEIQKTSDGTYLVASTGMDTILEFDEDFDLIWEWHMWEHAEEHTRPTPYYPNDCVYKDMRKYAADPFHRYHLNYVTESDGDALLCSALNYGIFKVDKYSGNIIVQNTGLSDCHNPVEYGGKIVVPESGENRIIVADWEDANWVMFDGDLSFCKDADHIRKDKWLIADTRNNRVLVWDINEPEPEKEFYLGEHSKPYEADYLEGGDSFAR